MKIIDEIEINQKNELKNIMDIANANNLPVHIGDKIIGFGKIHEFYMFYICRSDEEILIRIRLIYKKERTNNLISFVFDEQNMPLIESRISDILLSYKKNAESNNFEDLAEIRIQLEKAMIDFSVYLSNNINTNLDVTKLSVSNRLRNILINYKIYNLNDLVGFEVAQIINFRNCGEKSFAELIRLIYFVIDNSDSVSSKPIKELKCSSNSEIIKENVISLNATQTNYLIKNTISENSFLFHDNIEEFLIQYDEAASELFNTYQNIITQYLDNGFEDRDVAVIHTYFFENKKYTLQEIGDKFQFTRERARQIIVKKVRRIKGYIKKDSIIKNKINNILVKIDFSYLLEFLVYGLIINERQAFCELFLETFFDKDIKYGLMSLASEKLNEKVAKESKNQYWLQEKVYFTSTKKEFDEQEFLRFSPDNKEADFAVYNKIEKLVSSSVDMQHYVKFPLQLVYYSSTATDHKPLFCVYTKQRNIVLIVYCSVTNMSLAYNVARFRELHKYCSNNGYGYIITDSKCTLLDIQKISVDSELEKKLLFLLEKKGFLNWNDIKAIKSKFSVTNEIISSFVLNNKLVFWLQPYRIMREKK